MESRKYLKESISIIHLILVLLFSAYKSIKIDKRKFVKKSGRRKLHHLQALRDGRTNMRSCSSLRYFTKSVLLERGR